MEHTQIKLENPVRVQELNPRKTLEKIGLQDDQILCDIGAGSGIFAIPAATITKKKVYALDINEQMLQIIGDKAKAEGLTNIELVKVKDTRFELGDHSIDIVLLVTVLHEISDTNIFLQEVKRILKDGGKIVVIEFHKRETPIGPPVGHRIEKLDVKEMLISIGAKIHEDIDMGDNFYCLVFQK